MTVTESQQALAQLQALYYLTRRAPLTADEHEQARAVAHALADRLKPDVAPGPVAVAEEDSVQP